MESASASKCDRRQLKTRRALRRALAAEISATGDLSYVSVTTLCERADVTRRTFYAHYRDIPSMVDVLEKETIEGAVPYIMKISSLSLDAVEESVNQFAPLPYVEDLLEYMKSCADYLPALIGEGGDPAFVAKLSEVARQTIEPAARLGLLKSVPEFIFDYYLTFAISAEVGVLVRWLVSGMHESPKTMARIMCSLMFVRPGDLYGHPLDIDLAKLQRQAALKQGIFK